MKRVFIEEEATRIGLKGVIGVTMSPGVGSSLDEKWSEQREDKVVHTE